MVDLRARAEQCLGYMHVQLQADERLQSLSQSVETSLAGLASLQKILLELVRGNERARLAIDGNSVRLAQSVSDNQTGTAWVPRALVELAGWLQNALTELASGIDKGYQYTSDGDVMKIQMAERPSLRK